MDYKRLDKKAMYYMYTKEILGNLIFIAILMVAGHFIPWKDWYIQGAKYLIIVITVIQMLASPFYRYRVYAYKVDGESIDIKDGFLTIKRSIVPIERIHNIEISKGPLLRLFGLADLTIITAGSNIKMPMLSDEEAERIGESLQILINQMVRSIHDGE